jgi:hypothetical protein
VITVLGKRQAQEGDRGVQRLAHGQHGADRPAFAHEGRLLAEGGARRRGGRVVHAAVHRRQVRIQRRLMRDLGVGQALLDEALDEVEDLVGFLVGHQARRQLQLRPGAETIVLMPGPE